MTDDVVKVPGEDKEYNHVLKHDLHRGPRAGHYVVHTVSQTALDVLVEVAPIDFLPLYPLISLLVHMGRALLEEGAKAD